MLADLARSTYDKAMKRLGLVRVGVGTPRVRVANPRANGEEILGLLRQAAHDDCQIVVFPELALTGYTCADLFQQRRLLDAARAELDRLAAESKSMQVPLGIVGLPWELDGRLYNVAAVLHAGRVLALVPKTHLPNYKEFYEDRWFTPWRGPGRTICLAGAEVPFGSDVVFEAADLAGLAVGVELCEDLWVPIPPSSRLALAGATLLVNLSGSNEGTGKAEYRRDLVLNQSGRCVAAYVYAAAGVTESTTDLVFGGHAMIAENGTMLAEARRFARESKLLVADVDAERIRADRMRMTSFEAASPADVLAVRRIAFCVGEKRRTRSFKRPLAAHPFVPGSTNELAGRCEEIFQTQMAGLAKRLEAVQPSAVHIGVSGGLDSTLALLVAVKTADLLGWDRGRVHGLTMPGFGTSERTARNARRLMELTGVRQEAIDIRPACLRVFADLGHRPFGIEPAGMSVEEFTAELAAIAPERRHDLVFENVQARLRTLFLMSRGFVVSTGDLSELALGWCTYNGDHMGMYNPNVSIPKTLVRFLVRYVAAHEFEGQVRDVLYSIADTEISPELLPIGAEGAIQSTESAIGPYELHDFFLFWVLRYGFGPEKILFLARHAKFDRHYPPEEIRRWLEEFYRRFFASQFKRSCLPDGPKVGSVSLSPRGDWRMPSDAEAAAWLEELRNCSD